MSTQKFNNLHLSTCLVGLSASIFATVVTTATILRAYPDKKDVYLWPVALISAVYLAHKTYRVIQNRMQKNR